MKYFTEFIRLFAFVAVTLHHRNKLKTIQMTSIKIVNGKRGYILTVNGMYISHGFGLDAIKSIKNEFGIPDGATEWVSVEAIKNFWHKYMPFIIASVNRPYASVWGQLKPFPVS